MNACESLTTNGSCVIILKTEEMFHCSRSTNIQQKKKKTQNKLKLHFMPSTLFDLVSARRLFTQISPIMFPPCI